MPFVARSGGHGATEALAAAKDAIQIDFRAMDHVDVSADGKTAKIGGGANVKTVVSALMAAGKQTGKQPELHHGHSGSVLIVKVR